MSRSLWSGSTISWRRMSSLFLRFHRLWGERNGGYLVSPEIKLSIVLTLFVRCSTTYSEKQYKDRLAAWHIRKNIKAKEVHVMIRKQQKRAARGKQTAFRVGGQEVDSKRISRFVRRYGSSWEPTGSPSSAATPAAAATPTRGGRFGDPKSPQISYSPEPGMSFAATLTYSYTLPLVPAITRCRYPYRYELLYSRT